MRIWSLGRPRTIMVGMAALLGALALPAAASAGTASVTGSTLTYDAAAGETNDLSIETDAGVFRVIDNTAAVTAGTGCNQRTVHRVNCATAGITHLTVLARDQDDSVQLLTGTVNATLNGGSGTDDLASDAGDDTLSAGPNSTAGIQENLFAGAGDDVLNGSTGASASDFLNGGPDDDQLLGGAGNDSLFGDTGADDIQGGGGFDFLSFNDIAGVTVTIGAGANDGTPGENDNVHGDIEQIFGTSFGDTFIGSTGNETIFGGGGPDTLQGGPGDDDLEGSDGADTLVGDAGSDSLEGGNDADDVSGGVGNDFVNFGDHSGAVTVTINNNPDDGTGAEGDNVHTDVENLLGGPNNDTLTGDADPNQIQGRGGNDTVNGIGGDDDLYGDFQFNSGTFGNDTISGGNGEDSLFGGGGGDDMTGGNDFDFADYQPFAGAATSLTITIDNVANDGAAAEGDNVRDSVEGVVGGLGNDTITGNSGINTLIGSGGSDEIHGAGGNDLLMGDRCCSSFADVLDGGVGIDTVTYRNATFNPVTVDIDGVADDGINGGAEGDNVMTTVENLIGGESSDTLTGSSAANTILGRGGNDTLIGGASGDFLAGNSASDTHEGQAGKDEINSRGDGGPDTDNCGTEADIATADAFDTVNADCETRIP